MTNRIEEIIEKRQLQIFYGPGVYDSIVDTKRGDIITFRSALDRMVVSRYGGAISYNGSMEHPAVLKSHIPVLEKLQGTYHLPIEGPMGAANFVYTMPKEGKKSNSDLHALGALSFAWDNGQPVIIDDIVSISSFLDPTVNRQLSLELARWAQNVSHPPTYLILNAPSFKHLESLSNQGINIPNILRMALPYGELSEIPAYVSYVYIPGPNQEELEVMLETICSDRGIALLDKQVIARNMAREDTKMLNDWYQILMNYEENTLDFDSARASGWFEKAVDTRKSASQLIQEMIGMESQWTMLMKIAASYKDSRDRNDKKKPALTFLALGPPGVGKTDFFTLAGQAMYEIEILKKGFLNKVGIENLQAGFVGQSNLLTLQELRKSKHGIFFFDEFYTTKNESFGKSVVDTTNRYISENKGDTAFCFAGYEKETLEALAQNKGMSGRISYKMLFKPQTREQLVYVFGKEVRDSGLEYEPDVPNIINDIIPGLIRYREETGAEWANAREMATLVQLMKDNRAWRRQESGLDLYTPLIKEDIPVDYLALSD
jgi:hypothetical protein